jgi:hypothetical protein
MNKTEQTREVVARAIWNIRREDEDRCDMELEDMGKDHSVWREANAVIYALSQSEAPAEQPEAPILARVLELIEQAKALPSALTTVEPIALTPLQIAWIAGKLRKDADALNAEQPEAAQDERSRFEAWATEQGFDLSKSVDGSYSYGITKSRWYAWQAAKRDALTQAPQERAVVTDEWIISAVSAAKIHFVHEGAETTLAIGHAVANALLSLAQSSEGEKP